MFRFVDGERAARLDALDAAPPPAPRGIAVRRNGKWWTVFDGAGRRLASWATRERAERDAAYYRKAAGEG